MAKLAERRIENLDMGIAWTAHGLRGPLLGVRAVLELMLQRELGSGPDRELLRASVVSIGSPPPPNGSCPGPSAPPLELKRSDVVQIVEEAVQACRLETGVDRVVVSAPPHAIAGSTRG